VLVVGAGPAGLECAHALGKRGYRVHLAEATEELGGRVVREALLPGLAEWIRVRDHRQQQIARMANVEVYRASRLSAEDILDFRFPHVVIATGARWRRDGVGRAHADPVPGFDRPNVFSADDVMDGAVMDGPVIVFDDDHFYMGGVLAERLRERGIEVTLVTPADTASAWTINTLEQPRIQRRLLDLGISLRLAHTVTALDAQHAELACVYTGRLSEMPCAALVTVTARMPDNVLATALLADETPLAAAGIRTVRTIGDAWCPSTIAAAVYAGHRFAREFQAQVPFRRELPDRVA
jgi:dimethylamine/trimethylamine dehydrogenase